MNLSNFRLTKEDNDSYTVGHPKGKSIRVPKEGLSPKAHVLIKGLQHFDEGTTQGPVSAETPPADNFADVQALVDASANNPPQPAAPEPSFAQSTGSALRDIISNSGNPITNFVEPAMGAVAHTGADFISGLSGNPGVAASLNPTQANPGEHLVDTGHPPTAMDAASPNAVVSVPNGPMMNMGAGLQTEKNALLGGAAAEGKEGQANAQALQDFQNQMANQPTPQDIYNKHQAADQAFTKAIMDQKIDPNRYWNNQSTGSKISAGIGIVLSGIGSGLTGKPNLALEQINGAINRDIDSQKNDQSKNMNLWRMNMEATKNETDATLATQNQMLSAVKTKMLAAGQQAAGPLASARIAPQVEQIDQQMQMNNWRRSMMDPASSGTFQKTDPSQLVPLLVNDPEQRNKIYDEIGRAQNVATNSSNILSAFDNAAKDNTVLKTGAGYLRTPGSVMALHQLLLPNFKQIDGTVRQAAMDETFRNVTPAPGDSDATIAEKRQALVYWLHSESAAPNAKAAGIDLQRFSSTSADPRARFTPQQSAIYQEAKQRLQQNPQDPYGAAAMQKLGIQ
jgi:hypothetical protein